MTEDSPLAEIEGLVQEQARLLSLDTGADPGALRRLVEETVAQWSASRFTTSSVLAL